MNMVKASFDDQQLFMTVVELPPRASLCLASCSPHVRPRCFPRSMFPMDLHFGTQSPCDHLRRTPPSRSSTACSSCRICCRHMLLESTVHPINDASRPLLVSMLPRVSVMFVLMYNRIGNTYRLALYSTFSA